DGSSSRNIDRSSNYEGITAIVSKLYVIQVGCPLCGKAHLDKECPLNEEVKSGEEVKYEEFGRPSPFRNEAKYCVGLPGYYTRLDNRLPIRIMPAWILQFARHSGEQKSQSRRS
ncbi:hypothetical protein Tco_1303331, partial [Tanacetum coccineum]